MTHKRNRDLKTEVVELQLAAQHWEQKYLEAKRLPVCNGRCAALTAELDARAGVSSRVNAMHAAEVAELRASLGEASRELLALKERLSKYESDTKYESDQDEALSQYCNQPHDFE